MSLLLRATFHVASLRRIFYGLRDLLTSPQGQAPPGEPQLSCPAHAEFVICDCTIERLFRLWKEGGCIDEWRSKKPERILCELYGKLMGLLIQHWLLQQTCWSDPRRSLVKASKVIRDFAWDLLSVVQARWSLSVVVEHMRRVMRSTCRINQRHKFPSTAQLLLGEVAHA
jgi:hypothetical protein